MPPTDNLHPRPQLARERWTDLTGHWGFGHDDGDVGLDQGWAERDDVFNRTIIVPFPPESRASGIADPGFHPVVWYRRVFTVPHQDRDRRLILHFGAVDYRARVWVNGRMVAEHEGGQTPFSADITSVLLPGDAEQVVVVRAEDQPADLSQPRGKQDWEPEPHRIWYPRTTGIWQPVWLEPVGQTYVADLRWTPDLDRGLLGLHVRLNAPPERPLALRVRLSLRGASLADDTYVLHHAETHRAISLEPAALTMSRDRLLWSPRHPNLVDAEIILADGEEVIDRVASYAGIRGVGTAGGRFLLNGRPYYLRLVLEQGYWPESHLAAPSSQALRREVELVKELGFNGVRIHQKVEDPRFLYWCDRLGLLVWGEMANAYVFSPMAVERLTREWIDVVRRDYNHPCIITWVPLNESWGVPNLERDPAQRDYVRALYHLTKSLDPTRPVIGNDGWEHLASDVWGVHDYALEGETLRERYGTPEAIERTLREVQPHYRSIALEGRREDEPVMLTEFGGISYAPTAGERWHGYGTVDNQAAYLAKYEEIIAAVLDCPTIAGFCYTQLTDTEQEVNGLLTADRTPKLDPAAVHAITARPSEAVPGDVIANIQSAAEVTTFQPAGD
ncbi:MAG TPA: glycoside hydrolase family 2 TIM barrel-domain containing protein [Thermomicrobiales bacterium]|nr:glycoside hydrolase family 2 TIM barrel-domain containing protein [Thermomicrobiales bacterium]